MQTSKKPYSIERIISATSYITAGGVGFVWLIIAAFLRKQVTHFVMYHIMQSIFLSILYFLVSVFADLIFRILDVVPIVNVIPYLLNMPLQLIFGLSIVQVFTTVVILYLTVTSAMGLYSYIPWVSNIIKGNVGPK